MVLRDLPIPCDASNERSIVFVDEAVYAVDMGNQQFRNVLARRVLRSNND
jgi:hypothetical protein